MRPTISPYDRGQVAPTDSYRPGQLVWIWRHPDWREAVVLGASPRAVIARYQGTGQRGSQTTDTDTVTAVYVMARDEVTSPPDAGGRTR